MRTWALVPASAQGCSRPLTSPGHGVPPILPSLCLCLQGPARVLPPRRTVQEQISAQTDCAAEGSSSLLSGSPRETGWAGLGWAGRCCLQRGLDGLEKTTRVSGTPFLSLPRLQDWGADQCLATRLGPHGRFCPSFITRAGLGSHRQPIPGPGLGLQRTAFEARDSFSWSSHFT